MADYMVFSRSRLASVVSANLREFELYPIPFALISVNTCTQVFADLFTTVKTMAQITGFDDPDCDVIDEWGKHP